MSILIRKQRGISYYVVIGITALLAVLIGFLTTYITPSLKGSFKAPAIIHIHGAFALGWVLLFLLQTLLIRFRKFLYHRRFGYAGIFFALGIIITLPFAGVFQVQKELQVSGAMAYSNIISTVTTGLMFLVLVGGGFLYRKKPRIHKRLLLLATILIIWPAWFRFRHYFPAVPRPDIWFGVVVPDSLIIFSFLADKFTYGKVHPVLLYGGLFIISEHVLEVLLFDGGPWRQAAKWIYGVFA